MAAAATAALALVAASACLAAGGRAFATRPPGGASGGLAALSGRAAAPGRRRVARRVLAGPGPELGLLQEAVAGPAAAYVEALQVEPVPTKMATAAILATIGDAISQGTESDDAYDWRRGLSFAAFGGLYTGGFQHWWFQVLFDLVPPAPPDDAAQWVLGAAVQTGLCQFGTIPLIYLPIFFVITGALRGFTAEQAWERAGALYWPLWRRNINFWIPVQMVQFLFISPEWQVPYCCAAGLVWNVILSSVAGPLQVDPEVPEAEPKPLATSRAGDLGH